jgi:hypothetical protein
VEIYYGSPKFRDLSLMQFDLNLKTFPEDKVKTVPAPELGIGSQITVTRATAVNVVDAKVATTYRTWTTNVKQFMQEKNIQLLGQDSVTPDINSAISNNMNIKITRVAEVETVEKQVIDFRVVKKNSVDLEKGQTSTETRGANGEKQVTYKIKRVDGVEVSKMVIDTKTTKEPTNEVQIIGIGPKLAKSGPYLDTINSAAKEYLINGTALMCLMIAESNGHSDSINPDGPYYGLFQYSDGFWSKASSGAGYGGAGWENASAQIYSTAWALTHGYGGRWGGTWPRCSGK